MNVPARKRTAGKTAVKKTMKKAAPTMAAKLVDKGVRMLKVRRAEDINGASIRRWLKATVAAL